MSMYLDGDDLIIRAGLFKAGRANPGLVRILILNLQLFGEFFCLYCLSVIFEFE